MQLSISAIPTDTLSSHFRFLKRAPFSIRAHFQHYFDWPPLLVFQSPRVHALSLEPFFCFARLIVTHTRIIDARASFVRARITSRAARYLLSRANVMGISPGATFKKYSIKQTTGFTMFISSNFHLGRSTDGSLFIQSPKVRADLRIGNVSSAMKRLELACYSEARDFYEPLPAQPARKRVDQ